MRDFDGTHPILRQSPPSDSRSTSATLAPSAAAPLAATNPAGPPPITTKWYRSAGFGLRHPDGCTFSDRWRSYSPHVEGSFRSLRGCIVVVRQSKEALQPAAAEPRPPQSRADISTASHQTPDQFRAMILDHHDDDPLVEPEVSLRNPRAAGAHETRIETARVALRRHHFRVTSMHT